MPPETANMMDNPKMTVSEVYALYEAEVARLRAARDAGEHLQGVTMAMNEARRWLDRELDRAMPDPVPAMNTLGNRLRHNIAEALRLKLEREEREARKKSEREEQHRRRVSVAIDQMKQTISEKIMSGASLEPVRLLRVLEFNSTPGRWGVLITDPDHANYQQWQEEMVPWAKEQGLVLEVVDEHDGMGMESWQSLKVTPA